MRNGANPPPFERVETTETRRSRPGMAGIHRSGHRSGTLLRKLGHGLGNLRAARGYPRCFHFVEDTCKLCSAHRAGRRPGIDFGGRCIQDRRRVDVAPRGQSTAHQATSDAAAELDQFVNLVGELVTVQARLGEIAARHEDQDSCRCVGGNRAPNLRALRESSMSIRPCSADSGHLRTVPPACSRSCARFAKRSGAHHQRSRYRTRQDGNRPVERPFDAPHSQQHGSRY